MVSYPHLVPADGEVAFAVRGRALGVVFQLNVKGVGELHSRSSTSEVESALLRKAQAVMDEAVLACGYDWASDGFHPSAELDDARARVDWQRFYRDPQDLLGR